MRFAHIVSVLLFGSIAFSYHRLQEQDLLHNWQMAAIILKRQMLENGVLAYELP
jgi:hypothetical protein